MPSSVDTPTSVSLSALARLSVGLTVCRQGDGYFVTAYRFVHPRDEERVSFLVTKDEFLGFADAMAALAEIERSGGDGERTDEHQAEPVVATP